MFEASTIACSYLFSLLHADVEVGVAPELDAEPVSVTAYYRSLDTQLQALHSQLLGSSTSGLQGSLSSASHLPSPLQVPASQWQ